MATIMEKDVLLEYASLGNLLNNKRTKEMELDSSIMGDIWHNILISAPNDINFKEELAKIKNIRIKYENN